MEVLKQEYFEYEDTMLIECLDEFIEIYDKNSAYLCMRDGMRIIIGERNILFMVNYEIKDTGLLDDIENFLQLEKLKK